MGNSPLLVINLQVQKQKKSFVNILKRFTRTFASKGSDFPSY